MEQVVTKLHTFALDSSQSLPELRRAYLKGCVNMIFINASRVNIQGNFKYLYAPPYLETGLNEFHNTEAGTIPFYEEMDRVPEGVSEEQARRYCLRSCNWYTGETEPFGVRIVEKDGEIFTQKFTGPVSFSMATYQEFEPVSGVWSERNYDFNKFKRRFPPFCPRTYTTHSGKDYVERAGDLICGLLELDDQGRPVFKTTKGGKKIYKFKQWFNCSRQFFNMLKYFMDDTPDETGEKERKAFRGSELMTNTWRKWVQGQMAAGVELTPSLLHDRELNASTNEARFRWMITEEASIYSVHIYVAFVWMFVYGRYPEGDFVPNNIAGKSSVYAPQAPVQKWDLPESMIQFLTECWNVRKGEPIEVDNPYDKVDFTEIPGKDLPYPEKARRERIAKARTQEVKPNIQPPEGDSFQTSETNDDSQSGEKPS